MDQYCCLHARELENSYNHRHIRSITTVDYVGVAEPEADGRVMGDDSSTLAETEVVELAGFRHFLAHLT
jgi:hypothetical protein